jgi:alkyl sulfatase BDS1-like metallo-beta-lactamase superfamily hydrolase
LRRLIVLVAVCALGRARLQAQPAAAVKITSSVSMVRASGNVYLVVTPDGNVIIDTAIVGQASEAKQRLTGVSGAPVKYIILTHGHADHIGGIRRWKEAGTQVIAQRNYPEFLNYTTRLEGFFAPRNAAAFGRPQEKVGSWAGNYGATIEPTILFDDTYDLSVGGTRFQLFSTPGETPDHLTVWLPADKIAFIGDNYDGAGIPGPMSFPALYTLRGTKPRWALDWVNSIDRVLALQPEILLPGHGEPIVGRENIAQRLTRFRDAIQYVHDEVVKGMNAGKDVFTLMREIKLPATFGLSEVFGKVSWSVRGIYDGYAGWFDLNPTTMFDLPPASVYPDLVKLAGGPNAVIRLARAKLNAGKPVEVLHLTDIVLAYDRRNQAALGARLQALEYLREHSENAVEAGWLDNGIRTIKERLTSK